MIVPAVVCAVLASGSCRAADTSSRGKAAASKQAAVAGSKQAAARVPKKVDANTALLASGAKLHKEGKIDEAEAIFRHVLTNDPRNVDAFYDLGAIAELRGDYIAALGDYHAALALRPNDRELKEAVLATEALLRKNGSATAATHVSRAEVKVGNEQASVTEAPEAVPMAPLVGDYKSADNKKFRLSSRKDGAGEPLSIPTLGVPEQFPDVTTPCANVACPPVSTPTLTVGQTPTNNHTSRHAASALLSVGAGMALRGSPLHCPICRLMHGY